MTTSEANARQQGCSQKTRNGSQFLATRVTAATSIQTPGNNLGTGLGAQCAHPAAAPTQASRAPHERACTSTGTSRGHAGTDHPHRHARRLGEQERHKKARAHPSAGLTLPTPPGLRSAATYDKAGQTLTGSGPPVASSAYDTSITPTHPSYPRQDRARRRFPWPRDDESAPASAR